MEINPPYISSLNLDSKFLEDCTDSLRPDTSVQYPGDYIVTLIGGRVCIVDDANIAVITVDNFLVEELSFQWERTRDILPGIENLIFTNRIFLLPKIYKGRVFSLLSGGGAIHYYYHWLFDSIPKLLLLQASGLFDQVNFFLVPSTGFKFQREYLHHFGITEDKIISGVEHNHIQADRLMVSSYTRIKEHLPQWVCDFLYRSFITADHINKRDKLIYIGRGDAQRNRKVMNEHELMEVVKKLGFEVYFLSNLTVVEQAQLFNSAKMVVASHGGGLSNLVFCEPETIVLEFFPDNYVNHLFYDLSTKRKLRYNYLICESEKGHEAELLAETNLIADIDAIKNKIISLLGIH